MITLPALIAARDKCARIVADYGDVYLPIFIRLDEEVEARLAKEKALTKARKIAAQYGTQSENIPAA